jgi:hypothetical protein
MEPMTGIEPAYSAWEFVCALVAGVVTTSGCAGWACRTTTGHFGNYICKDPDSMAVGREDPIATVTFDQQEYRRWVAPKAMPAVSAASATY